MVEATSNRIVVLSPKATGFGANLTNELVNILVKNLNTGFSTVSTAAFKYGNRVLITAMGPGSGPYTRYQSRPAVSASMTSSRRSTRRRSNADR